MAAGALETLGLAAEQAASLGPLGSAVVAGGLASLVLAPAEATRIRMVSDAAYADLGLRGSLHNMTRPGLAGLAAALLAPTHRSRGPPACSRLPSGPKVRRGPSPQSLDAEEKLRWLRFLASAQTRRRHRL